jgi:DNA primase large subunit
MEQLVFAQNFPFTEIAKKIIKDTKLTPENVPEQAIRRAALMVSRAITGKEYSLDLNNPPKELMEYEVIAFPIAKMFVSSMNVTNIEKKFSLLIQKATFNSLLETKNSLELCIELANDFGVEFELSDEKNFSIELPLLEFLKVNFNEDELKLINQATEKGIIYLNINDFARFLSEKAYMKTIESLPIPKQQIPKKIQQLSKSIESQIFVMEKKEFDLKIEGKADPNLFPPCIQIIYTQQIEGKKLPHFSRLTLATFLKAVGMTHQEQMKIFSKSPDFKEHLASYQLQRIYEKDLSAPSCKKIAEYGLKVKECSICDVKHPLQYYKRELRKKLRFQKRDNLENNDSNKILSEKNENKELVKSKNSNESLVKNLNENEKSKNED